VMLIIPQSALAEIQGEARLKGRAETRGDLYEAIMEGSVAGVRPKR